MKLPGKTALVTGGARIGQTVARALARGGARVALTYRSSRSAALETLGDIRRQGGQGLALQGDLSRPEDVERVVKSLEEKWGAVDILVHLASIYEKTPLSRVSRRPPALSDGPGAVDLNAAWALALRCAPAMKKRGGRIILFSDWTAASQRPRYKDYLPYYVAKAGTKALVESLALELSPRVLVNAVAPGPILPPERSTARERREVSRATPLGRWGGAEEIAKAVLFFVESDFITGECLRVDGGRHLL